MAIIVEEEKTKVNILKIVMWVALLAIIGVAVYYIFFAEPQLVEFAVPPAFLNINPLATVSLNPDEVINGQAFQALKPYVTPPTPGNSGRPNPFAPPL